MWRDFRHTKPLDAKPFPIGTSDLSRNAIRTLQLRCFMKLGGREDTNQNFWLHPQGFDMLIQSCIPETEGKEDKDLALQNQAKSCKIRNKTATQSNTEQHKMTSPNDPEKQKRAE
jgi:hypothetical protein